jgi:hypothetical protein
MALFNDGPISSIEDLTGQDSQLLEVARVEGIDVTQKLLQAQVELSVELSTMLQSLGGVLGGWSSQNSGPDIGSVVVTPALKLWHTFRSLEMVYRDAYNSQLNDRYAGKRDQYRERTKWACEKVRQIGIGVAADPIQRAATPGVATSPGALADGSYYVAMAWTNGTGGEGTPSAPTAVQVSASTFRVQPGDPPRNARGWNVYVGGSPEVLLLQNESPLALDQTWVQAGTVFAGRPAGAGQAPNFLRPLPRVIQRG